MLILSERDVDKVIKQKLVNVDQLKEWQKVLGDSLIKFDQHPEYSPPRTVVTTDEASYLFMPYVDSSSTPSDQLVGIKTLAGSTKYGFQGSIVVLDGKLGGAPSSLINAKSLTPFRTALASSLAIDRYANKPSSTSVCAFGAGLQIYWHIKLILLLCPSVNHIYICNRTSSKAHQLVDKLKQEDTSGGKVKFESVEEASASDAVERSQIIICATSSTEPLLKASWLSPGTFIGLIGSYKPNMHEVGPDIMNKVNSRYVVDNINAVLHEAGEFITSNISPHKMVTIGDIISGKDIDDSDIKMESQSSLVIWKCVGLSVMDLCMSKAIQDAAIELNIGVEIDF